MKAQEKKSTENNSPDADGVHSIVRRLKILRPDPALL